MKTVSRVYDSYGQAREAVRAVEAAGVPSSEVSLIANKHVSAAHADVNEVSDTAKGAGIGAGLSAEVPDCWRASACWPFRGWGRWLPPDGLRPQRPSPQQARRRAALSERWSMPASRRNMPTSTPNPFGGVELS